MSIARKILENTFIQVLGKLVTAALSVVVLKIISEYLGAGGYGDYNTVYQFLALFGIIADFGIYTMTVKEMAKDERQIPMILGNVMGLRTLLAIGAMILAIIAAFLIPQYKNTLIPMGVLIATLATFFTLLNGTISSVLQVYLKMHHATIGLVIGKIVSVAYMAWVVFFLYPQNTVAGFYHLLWAGVIGNFIMFALTAYYTKRYAKITYRFDFPFWKKIFWTSLPYGVALAINTVYFRLDVILMGFILPHSSIVGAKACTQTLCADTEVGLYGVAQRMLEMILIIPVYFMNSVLPIMTRYSEEKNEKIKTLVQYSFDFLTASSLPLLIGGILLAVPLVYFVSTPEYVSGHIFSYGSDWAVRILMFAMAFSFVNSLFGFILVVSGQQLKLLYINLAGLLFNLISNIFVIPHWGFRGAAVITVISEFFLLVLLYAVSHRALAFHLSLKSFFKIFFSALIMGIVIYAGGRLMTTFDFSFVWKLAVLIPVGGLVYLAALFKTRAVTPEMMALLKKSETRNPKF